MAGKASYVETPQLSSAAEEQQLGNRRHEMEGEKGQVTHLAMLTIRVGGARHGSLSMRYIRIRRAQVQTGGIDGDIDARGPVCEHASPSIESPEVIQIEPSMSLLHRSVRPHIVSCADPDHVRSMAARHVTAGCKLGRTSNHHPTLDHYGSSGRTGCF